MSVVRDAEIELCFADGRSERVSLAGRTQLVIGRGEGVDCVLDRPGVDRQHVFLTVHDGAWWIVGGSSTTTGTWLSGRFVLESRRLVDGDVIQLGEVHDALVRYRGPGGAVEPAPPRFDETFAISADDAARRGLPRAGLRVTTPPGLVVMPGHDAQCWVTITSPPGGGPHARFVRGPRFDDRPNAPRVLQQHLEPRHAPEAIASGRVLAFGGVHPAIAWVWGESLGRVMVIAVAAPLASTDSEALVLAFSCRASGGLEPWLALTHPALGPLLRAEIS
jgi:hypothetical protein